MATTDVTNVNVQGEFPDAGHGTADIRRHVRVFVRHPLTTRLARAGYVTKGSIYLIMGALAGRVAAEAHGRPRDPSGVLTELARRPWGGIALAALTVGLVLYGLWNVVQAVVDTQGEDRGLTRVTERIAYATLGATYIGLAISAVRLIGGERRASTSDESTRALTALLFGHVWGVAIVVVAALVLLGIAVFFANQTVRAPFRNTFDYVAYRHIPGWIITLGRVGFASLAVINGTVGVLLLNAVWWHDARSAKGLNGALSALLALPHGSAILGAVAAGLVAYGMFSFAEARYRNLNRR